MERANILDDANMLRNAIVAGRLIRSGDACVVDPHPPAGLLAARDDIALVGGAAEQLAIEALSMLRLAEMKLLYSADTLLTSGWLDEAIEMRDDAESLLVVLGTLVLIPSTSAAKADAAAVWERRCRRHCEAADRLASALVHVLGDELQDAEGPLWLQRIARREPSLWWLSLRRAKSLCAARESVG